MTWVKYNNLIDVSSLSAFDISNFTDLSDVKINKEKRIEKNLHQNTINNKNLQNMKIHRNENLKSFIDK